jgi:hypothetical protein
MNDGSATGCYGDVGDDRGADQLREWGDHVFKRIDNVIPYSGHPRIETPPDLRPIGKCREDASRDIVTRG